MLEMFSVDIFFTFLKGTAHTEALGVATEVNDVSSLFPVKHCLSSLHGFNDHQYLVVSTVKL